MNFIPSSAWQYEQTEGFPPLPKEKKEGLIAGVRPEDISVSPEKTDDTMEVSVSLIEPAGAFNWIDVIWNETKVKGRAEVDAGLRSGSRAFMKLPLEKIILFDAASGKAISRTD